MPAAGDNVDCGEDTKAAAAAAAEDCLASAAAAEADAALTVIWGDVAEAAAIWVTPPSAVGVAWPAAATAAAAIILARFAAAAFAAAAARWMDTPRNAVAAKKNIQDATKLFPHWD